MADNLETHPIVSVIIPAHNAEKTIQETIQSVLNQTFTNFEIVIINDGSKDATLEIISNLKDQRIKVFSQEQSGAQKSRNRGINLALGKYITFIDADDLWTSNKLEAQLKAIELDPEIGAVYSWTNYIDSAGNFLQNGPATTFSGEIYIRLLLADFIGSGSNPMIKKEILVELGGFDEAIVGGQDWDMWLRVANRCHFAVVPEVQVLYRKSSNSWSTNLERQEQGYLQVLAKALQENSAKLQPIQRFIWSNRYKGLLFSAVSNITTRKQGILGARFLWKVLSSEPDFLQKIVVWKTILKIAIAVLLPEKLAQLLLAKLPEKFSRIDGLLFHMHLDLEIL